MSPGTSGSPCKDVAGNSLLFLEQADNSCGDNGTNKGSFYQSDGRFCSFFVRCSRLFVVLFSFFPVSVL
jgi:hypothetical protein